MKKILCCILLCCMLFTMPACHYSAALSEESEFSVTCEFRGLESFDWYGSFIYGPQTLTRGDFLSRYDYAEGDFWFQYGNWGGYVSSEKSLTYLCYEDTVYEEAKKHIWEQTEFYADSQFSYNGYHFFTQVADISDFPYFFAMVAYNDEKNTLVFLSFYIDSAMLFGKNKEVLFI